jgi:hypothetical protein
MRKGVADKEAIAFRRSPLLTPSWFNTYLGIHAVVSCVSMLGPSNAEPLFGRPYARPPLGGCHSRRVRTQRLDDIRQLNVETISGKGGTQGYLPTGRG